MERIAIVDGVRTPLCKMGTDFNDLGAADLGRIVAREVIERTGIDVKEIDEVIFGNVGQPSNASNIGRVISIMSGLPDTTPAYTVHRNCASGIDAVVQAAMKIKLEEGDCYLAGGAESMTNIEVELIKPMQDELMALTKAKTMKDRLRMMMKFYPKFININKSLQYGLWMGLTDPTCGLGMGHTAEVLAKEYGITREEQDQFAMVSHQKAVAAREILKEEIVPVIAPPKYKKAVDVDNGPRESQTLESLAKLKPAFDKYNGTVTAGNASQISDGACAFLITSEKRAKKLGKEPLGYMKTYAFAAVEPHRMGMGPAHAIPLVLKKAKMRLKEMQAIEINEAFAVQALACLRELASQDFAKKFGYEGYTGEIDPKKFNVNGGAVALGHPVGTTGARLILTMLKHMKRHDLNIGLISLCVGGGQGAAVILER
ncbi:MAG: thiolase family protein [Candidatus Omnitrophica bacterium]|nr:thiolase family protein [Candidatus Omnitrophota bacterium]